MKSPVAAKAPWTELLLVCGKCARKAGTPKFGKHLKSILKDSGAGKRIRIVDSTCLDLCPKNLITLALGREITRGRLLVAAPDRVEETATAILARLDWAAGDPKAIGQG